MATRDYRGDDDDLSSLADTLNSAGSGKLERAKTGPVKGPAKAANPTPGIDTAAAGKRGSLSILSAIRAAEANGERSLGPGAVTTPKTVSSSVASSSATALHRHPLTKLGTQSKSRESIGAASASGTPRFSVGSGHLRRLTEEGDGEGEERRAAALALQQQQQQQQLLRSDLEEARAALSDLNAVRKQREGAMQEEMAGLRQQLKRAMDGESDLKASLLATRNSLSEAKARCEALQLQSENSSSHSSAMLTSLRRQMEDQASESGKALAALREQMEQKEKEHAEALSRAKKEAERALKEAKEAGKLAAEHEAALSALKEKLKAEAAHSKDAIDGKDREIEEMRKKKEALKKEFLELRAQLDDTTSSWNEEASAHTKTIEALKKAVAAEQKKAEAAMAAELEARKTAEAAMTAEAARIAGLKKSAAGLVAAEMASLQARSEVAHLQETVRGLIASLEAEKARSSDLGKDLKRALARMAGAPGVMRPAPATSVANNNPSAFLQTPSVAAARRVARFLRSQREKRLCRSNESFRATMGAFGATLRAPSSRMQESLAELLSPPKAQAGLSSPAPPATRPAPLLRSDNFFLSPPPPLRMASSNPCAPSGLGETTAKSVADQQAKTITALKTRLGSCFASLEALRQENSAMKRSLEASRNEAGAAKTAISKLKKELKLAKTQLSNAVRTAEHLQVEGRTLWRRMLSVAKLLSRSPALSEDQRFLLDVDVDADAFALPDVFVRPLREMEGMGLIMTRTAAAARVSIAGNEGIAEEEEEEEEEARAVAEEKEYATEKPAAAALVGGSGLPSCFPLASPSSRTGNGGGAGAMPRPPARTKTTPSPTSQAASDAVASLLQQHPEAGTRMLSALAGESFRVTPPPPPPRVSLKESGVFPPLVAAVEMEAVEEKSAEEATKAQAEAAEEDGASAFLGPLPFAAPELMTQEGDYGY